MKKVAFWLSVALLFVTGYFGVTDGIQQLADNETALQQTVTFAVLIYGVLGLVGGVGLVRRRAWAPKAIAGWGLATVWAASIASFAYSDPTFKEAGTIVGTVTAFLSTVFVCSLVVWVARVAVRAPATAPSSEPTA